MGIRQLRVDHRRDDAQKRIGGRWSLGTRTEKRAMRPARPGRQVNGPAKDHFRGVARPERRVRAGPGLVR